jgi:1,4-dihydroxy-6-naphthoate synthase
MAYPHIREKQVFVFSDIEQAILDDKVDSGVLIHENRFTYEKKGLVLLADLGHFWEETTNSPIPLGGIMAHRRLRFDLIRTINSLIRQSLAMALQNPQGAVPYMEKFAQTMDPEVMTAHIRTFVTEHSVELGAEGRNAILLLIERSLQAGIINEEPGDIFIS